MTSSNGNIFHVTGPLCGNSPVTGEFPSQRPVTRSSDVFFYLRLNKRLSKQSGGLWFETPSRPLWHHHHVMSSGSWGIQCTLQRRCHPERIPLSRIRHLCGGYFLDKGSADIALSVRDPETHWKRGLQHFLATEMNIYMCNNTLSNKFILNTIHEQHFDLLALMGNSHATNCLYLIPHKFDIPYVTFGPLDELWVAEAHFTNMN